MVESSEIFEEHYQDYCRQISAVDLGSRAEILGLSQEGDEWSLSFFNERYWVSKQGILKASGDRPDYAPFIILAKYILLCPPKVYHDAQWVSFKDFKRVSHFTNTTFYTSDTERAIEVPFSGRLAELKTAGLNLGGSQAAMDIAYDLAMCFDALPRISLLLLFNDGDEEFPAKGTVLFPKHAEYYLDPESLVMTSAGLARHLKKQLKLMSPKPSHERLK